ncbi:hypothetical protein N403_05620 [Helicobacter pylori FD430]|nr:hypothetical protein N403_05620 [Helicobacter pylori FD430]
MQEMGERIVASFGYFVKLHVLLGYKVDCKHAKA